MRKTFQTFIDFGLFVAIIIIKTSKSFSTQIDIHLTKQWLRQNNIEIQFFSFEFLRSW